MADPVEPSLTPGAGPRPVKSPDDVLAVLPAALKRADTAPVQDAIVDSHTALQFAYQEATEYALAQADVGRATEEYLDGLADDRGFARALHETNSELRDRVEAFPALVTPEAIRQAINQILARFTTKQCEVFEFIDRWFVNDGTTSWHSFVATATQFAGPSYPERFFSGDAPQQGGKFVPNSDPGGAWVFSDTIGRHFVVRVPDLSGIGITFTYGDPDPEIDETIQDRWYVGDGSSSTNTSYINGDIGTALGVYQAIESTVNAIAGHSIRWSMWADPRL
jgi:hypothetical protein